MAQSYYVNKELRNGQHEVHTSGCPHPPVAANRHYLGAFSSCTGAVKEAKKSYSPVDGCYWCCNDCHTG